MRKNMYSKFILTTFIAQSFLTAQAQWTTDLTLNTPICGQTGSQRDPRILEDGAGGAFIVWKDSRTGIPDIYVQRVNSAGVPQWTIDGIGACTNSSDQSTPSIVEDMAGGIIVTWSDWRSGIERDIYAQRISGAGVILWTADGVIVTNKTEREHNERIISDGAGGCIIAWEQQNTSNFYWDIWAQRLNSNGVQQWTNGGIALSTNPANKRNPKLQEDENGGGYIVWQDLRNGFEYDIYAQHLDANGNRLWGTNALAVCNANLNQNNPKIDPDTTTGGVYIAWADSRNTANEHDIYCQRIDPSGNFLWATNGVQVCGATGSQTAVDILSDPGTDGIIAVWKDERNGNTDIYAQRLNSSGIAQWTTNGVVICNTTMPQINPNIAMDESGGAVIVWQDSAAGTNYDIKAQRINTSGTVLWQTNGVNVSNNSFSQAGPKNVSDKSGGTIVTWEDYRTGQRDIYAQRIYSNGSPSSIHENENPFAEVSVYPNPFAQQLSLSFSSKQTGEIVISISSIDGREIFSKTVLNHQPGIILQYEINPGEISKGIYFLTLSAGSQITSTKIVKF